MSSPIHVVGGGLAGSECAWQLAERGYPVVLWEMRPEASTSAHQTGDLAELVCSNSLRSDDPSHASGLLKREMESFGSLIVASARASAVPAGSALAVDRLDFAKRVTEAIEKHPRIRIERQEIRMLPDGDVVLATGPLTSAALSSELQSLLGEEHLYFYDAIAPIVEASSLDTSVLFAASRYDKGEGADYLNAPFDREQYETFVEAILGAEVVALHESEKALFFEGCLPVEEIVRRGPDTLRFGAMKPVGLSTPDGKRPWAVLQLRQEDLTQSHYNLVGFQSRMTWPEQRRVFRMVPGLEKARFVRLGQVHRNTFVSSPVHLDSFYRLRKVPRVRLAGQITGVEGYLESAATGLAAALYLVLERRGEEFEALPATTAFGALSRHLTESSPKRFQPANVHYGLFDPLPEGLLPKGRRGRRERRAALAERALESSAAWSRAHGLDES